MEAVWLCFELYGWSSKVMMQQHVLQLLDKTPRISTDHAYLGSSLQYVSKVYDTLV